jgi:hypothetical protein
MLVSNHDFWKIMSTLSANEDAHDFWKMMFTESKNYLKCPQRAKIMMPTVAEKLK